jgi:hypothetical protein
MSKPALFARTTARDRPHKRELQPLLKGDRKGRPYYMTDQPSKLVSAFQRGDASVPTPTGSEALARRYQAMPTREGGEGALMQTSSWSRECLSPPAGATRASPLNIRTTPAPTNLTICPRRVLA